MLPSHLSLLNSSNNITGATLYYNTSEQDIFSEIKYKRLNLQYKTNSYRDILYQNNCTFLTCKLTNIIIILYVGNSFFFPYSVV